MPYFFGMGHASKFNCNYGFDKSRLRVREQGDYVPEQSEKRQEPIHKSMQFRWHKQREAVDTLTGKKRSYRMIGKRPNHQ